VFFTSHSGIRPQAFQVVSVRRDTYHTESTTLGPASDPDRVYRLCRWITTIAGNGDSFSQIGIGIHIYAFNKGMGDRYFYNADGEMLFVPEKGGLTIYTELGVLEVSPGEVCCLPRGLKFKVEIGTTGRNASVSARGYICENYGAQFRLPELGPIGANGLANPRDFKTPVAWYEDKDGPHQIVAKFGGNLWACETDHSPLDVVAWHGNYAPYVYDLRRLQHDRLDLVRSSDPSIFTCLRRRRASRASQLRLRDLP
jgi:homogentisate 1,2-dioxygenase